MEISVDNVGRGRADFRQYRKLDNHRATIEILIEKMPSAGALILGAKANIIEFNDSGKATC